MSVAQRILPTKINLILTRRRLKSAQRMLELLKNKREALLSRIFELSREADKVSKEVSEKLSRAYRSYAIATAKMGVLRAKSLAVSMPVSVEVDVSSRFISGVYIPHVQVRRIGAELAGSPFTTAPELYEAVKHMRSALEALTRLASLDAAIYRLAAELRRTQRTINALEHVMIPRYKEAIKYISMYLEEREREELVKNKLLRKVLRGW